MVKTVTDHLDRNRFNTAISQMMVFINDCYKEKQLNLSDIKGFIKILSCFAPHLGEELWEKTGEHSELLTADWPHYDEAFAADDEIEYPVQFNGKVRFKIQAPANAEKSEVESMVRSHERFNEVVGDKTVIKFIVIPEKIVTVVIK